MKLKKKLILEVLTLILLFTVSISCVQAAEDFNISNSTSLELNSSGNLCLNSTECVNNLETVNESVLTSSNSVYIIPNGTGSGSNSSNPSNWTNAYNSVSEGGCIIFTNGTYILSNQRITKDLTLKSDTGSSVTLSSDYKDCIFYLPRQDFKVVNLTLINLTFTNGRGHTHNTGTYTTNYGGAIYGFANIINLDCTYINNKAKMGGAIYLDGELVNVNTCFINNLASYEGGAINLFGDLTVTNSSFINNTALYSCGGAIREAGNFNITGCSFINNTAPTGGAIYAIDGYTQNAHGICNTSIFISNTASEKYGGAIDTSDISINVNYCSFINNTSISQGETINYKHYSVGSFNYDYNWWGNNTPFNNGSNCIYCTYNNFGDYYSPSDWIIVNLSLEPDEIFLNTNSSVIVKFQTCNHTDLLNNMPSRVLNLNCTGGVLMNNSLKLSNMTSSIYTATGKSAVYSVNICVDNQILNQNIKVKESGDNSTILNLPYYYFIYGKNNTLTGNLTDKNGNPLSNKIISLNLTRLSDGAWKIYNVTTNSLGEFKLPITLMCNDYSVKAAFNGDGEYNSSYANVSMEIGNIIINTSDLYINSSTGPNSFNGTISTINGTPVANKLVFIYISRLSDGANILYRVLSNSEGQFSLTINLDSGNYYVQTQFSDDYILTLKNNFITVNSLSNETSQLTNSHTVYNNDLNPQKRELNGVLYTLTNNTKIGVSNINVTLELTRLSDGASKNYTVTTNNEGQYTLPITFKC